MSDAETWELFAIRYGRHEGRRRADNFIVPPDRHDSPEPIDYFVWAIVNGERAIVVDTGFDREEAARRGREIARLPREGLAMLGVDSRQVADVIVTHLHYDHAGTIDDFPAARFHLQDMEMAYATGRHMAHKPFGYAYSAGHVKRLIDKLFEGRLAFHDGESQVAPGVTVHRIGGHTMGMQCVRVLTRRGPVVLASDASHLYENMEATAPFPIAYSVADMVQGYETMRRLAESPAHIVPGHDPLVMERYPAAQGLAGVAVRLDAAPSEG